MAVPPLEPWRTAVTNADGERVVIRGHDLVDPIGQRTFAGVVGLLVGGRMPDSAERRLLDARLAAIADHGAGAPSAAAARVVATGNRYAPANARCASAFPSSTTGHPRRRFQTGSNPMPHTRRPFYGPWIIAACFFTIGISSGFPSNLISRLRAVWGGYGSALWAACAVAAVGALAIALLPRSADRSTASVGPAGKEEEVAAP